MLVPGDVNSTLAAALAAAKLELPIGHVEAGLRSFDRTMPEEVNRVLVDQICDLLFTHSPEARAHLARRGARARGRLRRRQHHDRHALRPARPHRGRAIGRAPRARARRATSRSRCTGPRSSTARSWATPSPSWPASRPSIDVVFPVHPRTRQRIDAEGIDTGAVRLLDPLAYLPFLSLVASAAGVLTDSGGIQEETTYLGVPCFTLRDNTERPVTCTIGHERAARPGSGANPRDPRPARGVRAATSDAIPPLWDGHAAERIADVLEEREDYRGAWASRPDADQTPWSVESPLRSG